MKKEYYKRFKIKMVPGDGEIADDRTVEAHLNTEIDFWALSTEKLHQNLEYRITNTEHTYLPAPAMSPGNPVVYIVVNIAYSY